MSYTIFGICLTAAVTIGLLKLRSYLGGSNDCSDWNEYGE